MVGEESISLEEGRRFDHFHHNDDEDDDDGDGDGDDDDDDYNGYGASPNDCDFQKTYVTGHPWIALNRYFRFSNHHQHNYYPGNIFQERSHQNQDLHP